MFEPFTILPEQLAPAPNLTPERRLIFAVLEDAVHVVTTYRNLHGGREGRLYREAYAWFVSDEVFCFSFVWCCQMLKLDAAWIRQRLLSAEPTPRIYRTAV